MTATSPTEDVELAIQDLKNDGISHPTEQQLVKYIRNRFHPARYSAIAMDCFWKRIKQHRWRAWNELEILLGVGDGLTRTKRETLQDFLPEEK